MIKLLLFYMFSDLITIDFFIIFIRVYSPFSTEVCM